VPTLEDEPVDPKWERTRLIGIIGDIYVAKLGCAAIQIADNLDTEAFFVGDVEPFDTGEFTAYDDLETRLIVKHSWEGAPVRAVVTFNDQPLNVRKYSLDPARALDNLTQETGDDDSNTAHKLERTTFFRDRAERFMQRILAQSENTAGPVRDNREDR
jgi:hypothetical protein